jgi:hypothetical protein
MDERRKHIIEMAGGLVPVSKESFINPVSDYKNFRQLMVSSEQIVIDAADQIIDALPKMPDDSIERVISTVAVLSKKLWYLRAACVAELLKRQVPPLIGGRGKKANGDGRNEFVKKWSEVLNIKPTKLREDMRITEVFGERFIKRQSGVLEKIPNEDEKGNAHQRRPLFLDNYEREKIIRDSLDVEQTVKMSKDGEFIEDVAFVFNGGEIRYAAHFSPHPKLNRQHYVVMSKLPTFDEAQSMEEEVIKRIEKGEDLTATKLNDELFVKSDKRGSYFKIQTRTIYGRVSGNLEFTLTEEDFKMLNEIAKLSLDINTEKFDITNNFIYRDILASSGDGYKIIKKALQVYLSLLKKDSRKWGIERNFDPENYTHERLRAKQEATDYDHKMWNRHRLDKENLGKIKAEVERKYPNAKPDDDVYKSYNDQLILVERAKINAENARAIYIAEENFQLEKVAELKEKAEKFKNKKNKKTLK